LNNSKKKHPQTSHPRPLFADSVAESFIMSSSIFPHIAESNNAM
jgi:hypothetical protein